MPSSTSTCSRLARRGCAPVTRSRMTLLCCSLSSFLVSRTTKIEKCCGTVSLRLARAEKADLELQKIIQKVLNNISAISTGSGGALQAELERAMVSGRSETVLLIGNKGSGKSTFVDRFFDQILPLSVRERCVVARVDLAEYHGDPERIVSWAILPAPRPLGDRGLRQRPADPTMTSRASFPRNISAGRPERESLSTNATRTSSRYSSENTWRADAGRSRTTSCSSARLGGARPRQATLSHL